jgi:hypothetical protein
LKAWCKKSWRAIKSVEVVGPQRSTNLRLINLGAGAIRLNTAAPYFWGKARPMTHGAGHHHSANYPLFHLASLVVVGFIMN